MSNKEIEQVTESQLNEVEAVTAKKKQRGLTTVEYAVAGALIAAAVVVAFSELGNAVGNVINNITNVIS